MFEIVPNSDVIAGIAVVTMVESSAARKILVIIPTVRMISLTPPGYFCAGGGGGLGSLAGFRSVDGGLWVGTLWRSCNSMEAMAKGE